MQFITLEANIMAIRDIVIDIKAKVEGVDIIEVRKEHLSHVNHYFEIIINLLKEKDKTENSQS